MSVSIFFCYAHEDEDLLNKLKRHLWPLQRQGLIAVWHDRDISAGTEWEQEIHQHLNAAQIILLLVSPDFMYSEYCYGIEMQRALERHKAGEARVIPVIVRSVYWQGILGNLQALPTDAKPVRSWADVDEAFLNVAEGIRTVVEHISAKLAAQAGEEQQAQFSASSAEAPTHIQAAEPTTSVVDEPKPAPSKPAKVPEAKQTPSAVHVPTLPPAKPLPSFKPETLSLLRTLTGHTSSVFSVAFSPDGQTVASGSDDKTIKLWNVATGQEVRTLTGHTASVFSVAFSPDGQTVASGSDDKTIELWNVATGQEVRTLTGHTASVFSVAFSPDGQTVASGSDDKTIELWNVATGEAVRTLTGHTDAVESVAFSPDGQIVASGSEDKTIKIWDVAKDQKVRTLKGHKDYVASVAFSPDGQTLASGSADGTIELWNVATGQEVRTLIGHTEKGQIVVAFSPDGQTLASCGQTIELWNVATGKAVRTLKGHTRWVYSVAFSPDGKTLASGGYDEMIMIWGNE